MVVRGRGRPPARSTKPAISSEVSTDPPPAPTAAAVAEGGVPVSGDPSSRSPRASACEPYHELIVEALGRGRNAMAIWQDLVDDHGFPAGYSSVRRFVSTFRGRSAEEGRVVIATAPAEEAQVDYGDGPMVRDPGSGKYRRTTPLRPDPRLLAQVGAAAGPSVQRTDLGRAARAGVPAAWRHRPRRRASTTLKEGVLAPDIYDPALNPLYRDVLGSLRRRRPAVPRPRPRSQGEGGSRCRPREEDAATRAPLRAARRRPDLPRPLGAALGRHPHPRHDQAAGRRDVRRGTAGPRPPAARAVPLLPVRPPHRASRRLRRCRVRLLRGAAGMDRPSRPRPVERRPRAAARPPHRPAPPRAPARAAGLASHPGPRPARPHPAEDPRPARRRQAGRPDDFHHLRPHPPSRRRRQRPPHPRRPRPRQEARSRRRRRGRHRRDRTRRAHLPLPPALPRPPARRAPLVAPGRPAHPAADPLPRSHRPQGDPS